MIKFPKVHIATSVVNRILNAYDEIPSNEGPVRPSPAPSVPQPQAHGKALDAQLATGAPEMPSAESSPSGVVEAIASGETALDGLLEE